MEALGNVQALAGSLPLDWFVLAGILIVTALDSLRSGMGRAISISLALPIALYIYNLADRSVFTAAEGLFSTPFMQIAVFAILAVGLYILIRRMGFEYVDSGMGAPVQAILAGAAVTILAVCVWLETPVLTGLWALSSQIETVFAETFRIGWLIGAYVALAFARG